MLRYSDVFARMQVLSKASTFGLLTVMAGGIVALEPINDVTSIGLAGLLHLVTTPVGSNLLARATYFAEGLRYGIDTTDELRSEEHTSALHSLMRISYADLCLKKKHKK